MGAIPTISTNQFTELRKDPAYSTLDLRPTAAFNGWRLNGEERGGHIPGAVAFPLEWFRSFTEEELRELLSEKGVTPAKGLILCAYAQTDLTPAIAVFEKLGFDPILVYQDGFETWTADPQLPIASLPRYERLVYPGWLFGLLASGRAAGFQGKEFAVFQVNSGGSQDYANGHIPGASFLDCDELEDPKSLNVRSPHAIEKTLLAHGIRQHTTVILYGNDNPPAPGEAWRGENIGQSAAMRTASILMYAGVEDVRVLDGGMHAWRHAGYAIERGPCNPYPVLTFGVRIPAHPEYILDLQAARALRSDPNASLVDIRSWGEYTGERSGYTYINMRGRIRDAVWGNSGSDTYHMQHYRNPDNSMRAYPEIEAAWRRAGITADKRIAFYCGTGWRAAEAFFYAYLMGWTQIAVYDGGWYEWSQEAHNNPISTGSPQT